MDMKKAKKEMSSVGGYKTFTYKPKSWEDAKRDAKRVLEDRENLRRRRSAE